MIFLRERTRSLRAALLIAMLAGGILHNAGAEDNGLDARPFRAGVAGASSARIPRQPW